ncbi:hypothetical protein SAMN05444161_7480 [Rhizobiales bacterium GAS191]|jgi:hypothetical protein|nr:hypothetical protein SAMN05519104_3963 [Rhizobiales bacterium GAS188]SEE85825.1 hypothetical protein SAMN05444161_7480 [Rhizobiales bacterium GAS191]
MRTTSSQSSVASVAWLRAEEPTLPLLLVVLNELRRQSISYCYWKASRRVHLALTGESDLDLLIAKEDQHRAQAILLGRGFKLFPCVAYRDHPAILSFLGHDESSGQLLHLHLYFRLVVGAPLLKNYRIPWEDAILARSVSHPTLPIHMLDPASEALLLVIRSCLELHRSDPVTLRHWHATQQKFALDRQELVPRVERATLHGAATELMGRDLADRIADAFYSGAPLEKDRRLRRLIRKHFAPYRSYNGVEARVRSAGRALQWIAGGLNKRHLHWPRPWARRAPGGGLVIAMVGVDGSGKSTAVAAVRAWLGAEIDVMPIYFGTGDGRPSLLLLPLKLMMPLFMRLYRTKPKGASHGKISDRPPGLLYGALQTVWAMVVAREKRAKLIAARRAAERGLIVIADRYPQDEILGFNDGPLLTRLRGIPQWLRRTEAAAYALARRLSPDLVIKLEVMPATAARREPDMDPTVIRDRIGAVKRLTFFATRIVSIDAEEPLAEVTRKIKREIWRQL